jgi:hypothetical protein
VQEVDEAEVDVIGEIDSALGIGVGTHVLEEPDVVRVVEEDLSSSKEVLRLRYLEFELV